MPEINYIKPPLRDTTLSVRLPKAIKDRWVAAARARTVLSGREVSVADLIIENTPPQAVPAEQSNEQPPAP